MARLWTCGFELQSAAAGVEILSVTGTPTISTTVHRAGAASLRINPTAATQYAEQQITGGVVGRYFHRFYLRVATLPAATTPVYAIGQSGYFPCYLRLSATGTLRLHDAFLGADVGTASAALTVGQWYRVELDHTDVTGAESPPGTRPKGDVVAYVDGANFSGTAQMSNINGFSRIRMGAVVAGTMDVHLDDVAVNDTSGSTQNGLPGPGNVIHLRPDSAGDNAGWATTVGGSSNWGRVSEITPDDATTYNETTAAGTTATDDHNLSSTSAAGISGERVKLVAVGGRIGSNAATAASLVYRIKSQTAGTVFESGSVSVAVSGWATHKGAMPYVHQLTSYTDPQAGGSWTTALLDQAQIGYRSNVSQATVRRVSALWALVETVPITIAALTSASETAGAQPLARRKTLALGTATETSTARALNPVIGVGFAALADGFTDNVVDPVKWPDSYDPGGFTEAGGRARVACSTSYNAYASAETYRLRESHVHVRMWPPAAGGAVAEAWAQLLVQTQTLGTDAIFEVSAITGNLIMASRTGYFDPAQVAITYDSVAHAWLRIRETGGNLLWDTSPDGSTWTNRRTSTSPAWVGDTTLQVQLIAHRDGGVDDFAEFDSFNTGAGQTIALVPAVESAAARSLAGAKSRPAGVASEATAAQLLGKRKARAQGTATENTAAQLLARGKRRALPPATASETAQALARTKRRAAGVAASADAAQPLAGRKARAAGAVGETSTALALARTKRLTLGVALDTSTARPLTGGKTRAVGIAEETSTALLLSSASSLQPAEETTTARPLGGRKRLILGVAVDTAAARPLGILKSRALLPGVESASSLPLGGGKARALAPAEEAYTARTLAGAKARALTPAGETSSSLPLTGSATGALGGAEALDTARPLTGTKRLSLGTAVEVTQALIGPYYRLGVALEVTQALPLTGARQRPADSLTPGAAGPVLVPDADGPQLAASSSAPHLTTTSTNGG